MCRGAEPTTESFSITPRQNFNTDIQVELKQGDRVEEPVDKDLVRKGGQMCVAVSLTLN